MVAHGNEGHGMAQETSICLADERIDWKVPSLFGNDRVALSLAQALNPLLPKPLFSSAYGCPVCAWAGGRNPRVRESLSESDVRRYFEAYRRVGAFPALTFSRPDAGDFLDDAYCELLLSLAEEYGGQAIVVDDRLAQHIREVHPNVKTVASYNRCIIDHAQGFGGMSEEDYYRSLLERYDEVVIRCEAAFEGCAVDRMADLAGRIQIIVNQKCVPDCPDGVSHIMATAQSIQRENESGERVLARCTHPLRGVKGTVYIGEERRRALADMGFTQFKLQGRIASPTDAFKTIVRNILKDGMEAVSSDALMPVVLESLSLDGSGTNFDAMVEIPASLEV